MPEPNPIRIALISLHGLLRGDRLELGRDEDTGGQTRYVLELARALGAHDQVERVDLITRQVEDDRVSDDYAQLEEPIADPLARPTAGPRAVARAPALSSVCSRRRHASPGHGWTNLGLDVDGGAWFGAGDVDGNGMNRTLLNQRLVLPEDRSARGNGA